MTLLPTPSDAKPSVHAAVLLLARKVLEERPWPGTVAGVLAITGAGRSQAYAMLPRLRAATVALVAPAGRPPSEPSDQAIVAVLRAVRDFLMEHPGAVAGRGARRRYSEGLRRFVVGLGGPGGVAESLTVEQLADASGVSLGALKDWLRMPAPSSPDEEPAAAPAFEPARPDIASILAFWPTWEGSFQDFCRMLRDEHRLTAGDTFVGNVLQAAGLRNRKPRGRDDAPWSRDTWRKLFPGAQWLGDGTTVALRTGGEVHVFNIEVVADPTTNAITGVTVTDTEDERAVLAAFEHGTQTTGEPPLALTLDNKPSNHSPAVEAGVAPAELLRSTPGRGQAKAPLEGFGLFQQTAPPLVVRGRTPREQARSYLALLFVVWAWARNGKPRRKLGGRSPAEAYAQDRPTPEELAATKAWLAELRRREEQARKTRAQKADPVRRALLDGALAELHIPDPEGRLAGSLARYGMDSLLRAIAAFRARLERGTLPPDVDAGRYFAGIVRNLDTRLDLERMGEHLLEIRLRHRDLTLAALQRELHELRSVTPVDQQAQATIDRALAAGPSIDFRFWARVAAGALAAAADPVAHYRHLVRRVAASFATDRDRRAGLIDALAQAVVRAAKPAQQQLGA